LFDCTTITRMLGHFQTLLEGIVADPNQRLADLPILTATERQQLLVEWNQTEKDYSSDRSIHQLFEEQVNKTPDAIAVVYKDEQLTYQELNRRSNKIAHYLQKLGVTPEVLVGICVERSPLMIVGILGILKAGGAYLPLDPTYPPERLKFMLEDSQVSILLTQQSGTFKLPISDFGLGAIDEDLASFKFEPKIDSIENLKSKIQSPTLVCCDRDREIIAQQSQENPISGVTSKNLAYVIYTSGSTGRPKGVLVQHQGLCNLAQAQIQTFDLKPDSTIRFA